MADMIGLTRAEILAQIPNLNKNSFRNFRLLAKVEKVGEKPNWHRPHLTDFLYELDSVERIKAVMPKKLEGGAHESS